MLTKLKVVISLFKCHYHVQNDKKNTRLSRENLGPIELLTGSSCYEYSKEKCNDNVKKKR